MKMKTIVITAALTLGFSGGLHAQDLADQILNGCAAEIESYCSQVSPGEGRLLACFYAHEDKLSGQCQYALYDAAAQLERAVATLTYVAGQCESDMIAHCASVQMGEGRILECLRSAGDAVSAPCIAALDEVFE